MTLKQQIHSNLITIIETAFLPDVVPVKKRLFSFEEVVTSPTICVSRAGALKEIAGNSNLYQVEAGFEIIGYIRTSYDIQNTGSLTDACEEVLEKIEEAILVDETIYDLGVTKIEIVSEDAIPDYENNIGYAILNLTITYLTNNQI